MDLLILLLIIGLVIYVIAKLFSKLAKLGKRRQLYQSRSRLFTAAERSFLGVLDQACGERYRVFGKVRVADILRTVKGLSNSDRQSAFNRISGKHVDFVLCDPKTLEFKAVVELNDSSHKRSKRAERDAFLRDAFEQAGLPYIEVPAQRSYTVETVRSHLRELEVQPEADLKAGPEGRIEPRIGA